MVPRILHLCFGLAPDFGGKPWSLVHHVCLRSAIERLRPERVLFHHEHEPRGPWWELSRPLVTPVKSEAPREAFGRPLLHVAHRADLLRLNMLVEHGGVYLDADVFVHRDFDDLMRHAVVLGREGEEDSGLVGLCNAVILARPGAPFLIRWIEEFRAFRSTGADDHWNELSVRVPLRLSREFPDEVTVLPHNAFFWPLGTGDDLTRLFGPSTGADVRGLYANHLWESLAWWRYLRDLTPGRVRALDTPFHLWARPYLADLPDGFGAPTLTERVQRKLRHTSRQWARWMRR